MLARLVPGADGAKTPEIIGVGMQGAAAPQAGIGNGSDLADFALRAAVDAAERMAGERVRDVCAAVPGRALLCRRVGVELPIESGRVAREDVVECLAETARAAAPHGFRALHALPIGYTVDGEDAGADPVGLAGANLDADMLGVGGRENSLANLESLIQRCGLRVEDAFAAPLAAAEATLLDDEKELGVVLIDLGARSTNYAVYLRGALVDCGGAPVGGDHVTRDIAAAFGAPLADAERAKTLYGAAFLGAREEQALLDLRQLGDDGEIRVSRAELAAVIAPRMEEIFELTLQRLSTEGRDRRSARRLVLTGGGSLLVGARETAERVLGMRARLGRPAAMPGAPDAATAPQFSVCAGLIQLATKQRTRRDRASARAEQQRPAAGGVLASVGQWLRDNF